MSSTMNIKVGTILLFEAEIENRRRSSVPYRALRSFDQAEICAAFHDAWQGSKDSDITPDANQEDFIDWLEQQGIVAEVQDAMSWHLGVDQFNPALEEDCIVTESQNEPDTQLN